MTCTNAASLYNNVILCYVELDLPVYITNINLKKICDSNTFIRNLQSIRPLQEINNQQTIKDKFAKNVESAKILAGSNYGVYLCRSSHTSLYEVFTDRDKTQKLCDINIVQVNFPSNSFVCHIPLNNVQENRQRSNGERNIIYGGSKKKIHTGKRGGKYYIKNGKKVYV